MLFDSQILNFQAHCEEGPSTAPLHKVRAVAQRGPGPGVLPATGVQGQGAAHSSPAPGGPPTPPLGTAPARGAHQDFQGLACWARRQRKPRGLRLRTPRKRAQEASSRGQAAAHQLRPLPGAGAQPGSRQLLVQPVGPAQWGWGPGSASQGLAVTVPHVVEKGCSWEWTRLPRGWQGCEVSAAAPALYPPQMPGCSPHGNTVGWMVAWPRPAPGRTLAGPPARCSQQLPLPYPRLPGPPCSGRIRRLRGERSPLPLG